MGSLNIEQNAMWMLLSRTTVSDVNYNDEDSDWYCTYSHLVYNHHRLQWRRTTTTGYNDDGLQPQTTITTDYNHRLK
jgi:hypothetical protein